MHFLTFAILVNKHFDLSIQIFTKHHFAHTVEPAQIFFPLHQK